MTPDIYSLTALIEALTIIRKYGNPNHPVHCEHDELFVKGNVATFSKEDIADLESLGFTPVSEGDGFKSFRFGSC